MATVSFLTPSFAGDIERFALLRESIRELGIEIPHVAVIQGEHMQLFERRFRAEAGLTLLTTATVLGADADRRRRRGSGRRPRTPYGLATRALQTLPSWTWSMSGWSAQQLVKLAAADVVETDHWICLDSDTVFLRRIATQDFFAEDGRLYLNRRSDPGDQQPLPRRRSASLLGINPKILDPSVYYVDFPVPFHRGVVNDLLTHIADVQGTPWARAFLRRRATEYMTYGLFAEHVDGTDRVVPRRLAMTHGFYDLESAIARHALERVRDQGFPMAMVHSLLPADVDVLREAARRAWRGQRD